MQHCSGHISGFLFLLDKTRVGGTPPPNFRAVETRKIGHFLRKTFGKKQLLKSEVQLPTFQATSPPRWTLWLNYKFQTGRVILVFSMQKSAKCAKRKEKKRQEKAQLLNISVVPDWHTAAPWRGLASAILTNYTSVNDPTVALGGRYDRRPFQTVLGVLHFLHIGPIPSGIKRKHIVWFPSYESGYCNGLTALPRTLRQKILHRFCPV